MTSTAFRRLVAGRLVKHTVGTTSQTLSVRRAGGGPAQDDLVYRFPGGDALSVKDIPELSDAAALHAWMLEQGGVPERPGHVSRLPRLQPVPDDDDWTREAVAAVEHVLTRFVDDFRVAPYHHRVEHSVHAELFALLRQQPVLARTVELVGGHRTQLVHKEWPETRPWTRRGRRTRGLFDLAVLHPDQVGQATLEQFRAGRIEAPIVIEVGLDYGLDHLDQDVGKLRNSAVRHPYLLHLSRLPQDPSRTEQYLSSLDEPLRWAYVQQVPGSGARYSHVGDLLVLTPDAPPLPDAG